MPRAAANAAQSPLKHPTDDGEIAASCRSRQRSLERRGPVARRAHAALDKVESLGSDLPLIQHMTQVMPVPDFFFGGGMLLLIVLIHATGHAHADRPLRDARAGAGARAAAPGGRTC